MRKATLSRGRLHDHPIWSRGVAAEQLAGHAILPLVVSSAVEDREKVEGMPWLERLSLTEAVREARTATATGFAGVLLLATSDRKDEHALLAAEPDHVLPRAIRAVKEAAPDLGVATEICVCTYTSHGQCVLFGEKGADVPATFERLAAMVALHADSGADLLIAPGMLEGTARVLRTALAAAGHDELPVAAGLRLESALEVTERTAVGAVPIRERAVQLLAVPDAAAALARARRDVADEADALLVQPGAPGLDVVARLAAFGERPVIARFTADEHALFAAAVDGPLDAVAAEREHLAAARRAGASLLISWGAQSAVES